MPTYEFHSGSYNKHAIFPQSRLGARRLSRLALLCMLSLVAGAIPLFATLYFLGIINFSEEHSQEILFPQALEFSNNDTYLKVNQSDVLVPRPGQDFLLLFWVQLKRLPPSNQKLILLSKYDAGSKNNFGYALAVMRENSALRPAVYWNGFDPAGSADSSSGRWYEFSEINIHARSWFLFALSYHDDKYLGVHIGQPAQSQLGRGPEIWLSGGYEVGPINMTAASADLVAGAFQERQFRGFLGPIYILSADRLARRYKSLLKEFNKQPLQIPDSIKPSELKLAIMDGNSDNSSHHHKVELLSRRDKGRN